MLLNDAEIKEIAVNKNAIIPYTPELIRNKDGLKVLSYGQSSFGYDLRLSPKQFMIFQHLPGTIVNPKRFNPKNLREIELQSDGDGEYFVLPGNSYGLGVALEKLTVPPNVTIIFIGKSTYARCGVIVNVTPGEAGWQGYLTIEISNASCADVRVYANEGIVQALFLQGSICETNYEKREGKYQNQDQVITFAKV